MYFHTVKQYAYVWRKSFHYNIGSKKVESSQWVELSNFLSHWSHENTTIAEFEGDIFGFRYR
jgi:hypothetical protein